MAQSITVTAGISEGHVPEFHLILTVRAFLCGEAALVHGVGNVQESIGGLQKGHIGLHFSNASDEQRDVFGQGGDSSYILGDGTYAKGPGPGLQAHKHKNKPGENGRDSF